MKELNELRKGLKDSNIMLVKEGDSFLECSFLKKGLVNRIVVLKDQILMEALRKKVNAGVLEGVPFYTFRHEFESFALHVKSRRLYSELAFTLPKYGTPEAKEEAYSRSVSVAVA